MMKFLAKGMMGIGIAAFFIGASGMDDPSIALIVIILAGMGLIFLGNKIDEEWV